MSEKAYDLCVVGAGPGGYVAAIRAAQLGLKTLVVEKEKAGGVCLNHGCIPSKALIHAADVFAEIQKASSMGVECENCRIELAKTVAWKDKIVKRLTGGIQSLFKANGVEYLQGEARLTGSDSLAVVTEEGEKLIRAEHTIIATGAQPIELPSVSLDGTTVISSREALALDQIPPRIIVIGGGYIGLELGIVFAKLGSAVTVVELLDGLLPVCSREAVKILERTLRRLKIKVMLQTKAKGVQVQDGVARLTITGPDGQEQQLEAEKVLLTVGRKPSTSGLGLENTEAVLDEKGFIRVDAQRRTADRRIFAIGDVTGEPMLAHKAGAEGVVAADAIAGKDAAFSPRAIAAVVFTDPEIAMVGLNVEEAKSQGFEAEEASFPFIALGRALTMNAGDGYAKWVFDARDHTILGCEIVGREASNLIGEAALAVEKQLKLEDVAATIHPHPTLTEGLAKAAELALGNPIHLPKKS